MTEALRLDDLKVRVGGTSLLHGISLTLSRGESVALLGHSGSGKSLTAATIAGSLSRLLDATGDLTIEGERVDVMSSRRPAGRIACVQQDSASALNPLVRVGRQLGVPLSNAGLAPVAAHARAVEVLDACGIEEPERVLRSYPAELSGGQRQRVCIALALLCEASILVADEPTTALDVVSQAQVLGTLSAAQERAGMALLFITHDIAAASQICDRAVVLQGGRVVEEGDFETLITAPRHPYTRELVDAVRAA
ncbi:ATP-binding cassette domain-containing protein [Tessaracoccus caeni]|uniref:ATP-binding cassette domain-containing protein n=1 Tax=Tessaracoccus caeni TaxID=3031239 RepID=UPI0023D9B049|nr:ABC transporter ATP-binding protein [Tessaracoccus caeni]MDF1489158.1 ABC transporter ATP-binding protein [Tessaracoccus caeni]